jgi:hypothetical protein
MTPEQRLDRLERIAKLFAKAGLRARKQFRQQYEILMDAQMRNEARFVQNEERFQRHEERFQRDEERLTKLSEKTDRRFSELAESQARTDRSLNELIKIVTKGQNGNHLTNS